MAHHLNQADELPFVRRQLCVVWCDLAAEEGNRAYVLMKHCTKPRSRRVALNNEGVIESQKLQD
jgi:hypothetical protein